jgi:hypothetical protein
MHPDVGKKEYRKKKTPNIDHHIKTHLTLGHSRTPPTSELHHDVRMKGSLPSTG